MQPEYNDQPLAAQAESAAEAMRRIERELRSPAVPFETGAGVSKMPGQAPQQQATARMAAGPLSAMGVAAADPQTQALQALIAQGKLNVGPVEVGYQRAQPMVRGARPEQTVSVGGRPFDADTYFEAQASQGPGGRSYGATVGRDGLNAYGQYNPARKDVNVGMQFQRAFADGGPVMPSADPMEGFSIEPEARPAMQPQSRVGTGIGGALSRMGQGISDYVTADPTPSPRELLEARMSEQARVAMDLSGLALPDRAVDVKADEFGSYPVDAEGNRLKYLRRSMLLPMASGEGETRLAMPMIADIAGNLMSGVAPAVKGSGMVLGSGPVRRGAQAGTEGAEAFVRELSPVGLYSQGEEAAMLLPQARGTPEQFAATLEKRVKPVEMEGFRAAFADRPQITKEEAAAYFKENMPQIERKVLGQKTNAYPYSTADEWQSAINRAERQGNFDESQRLTLAWEEAEGLGGAGTPKFQQYTLPGGENYREVQLTLKPQQLDTEPAAQRYYNTFVRRGGEPEWSGLDDARKQAVIAEMPSEARSKQALFKSSHWDEPDVLVHTRMADRTGPNNEKILHVEEIQSDWGQKGKKEGFVTKYNPEDIKEVDPANITSERRRNEFWNFQTPTGALDVPRNERFPTIEAARQHILDNVKPTGVPSAPYVTNTAAWTDLALKDILREAAEGGYDKVVWTPGAEQAKRYSLTNTVSRIGYEPATGELYALDRSGAGIPQIERRTFKPEELPGVIGKDATEKLLSTEPNANGLHVLNDQEIPIGGEGMKGYYDKIVPTQLSKLLKKLDPEAKIGTHEIRTAKESDLRRKLRDEGYDPDQIELQELLSDNGGRAPRGFTEADLDAIERGDHFKGVSQKGVTAPAITITPKMRENILKGQAAYAEGGEVEAPQAGVNINQATQEVLSEIRQKADEGNLDQRKIAYLIRMSATGTFKPESAYDFAGEILEGDLEAIRDRFAKFPRTLRILSRLDRVLGGEAGRQYGVAANERQDRPPVPLDGSAEGFAKGGKVKARKPARMGSKGAMEEFSAVAERMYGAEVAKNIVGRSGTSPTKVMFAMNQYAKNLMLSNPQRYAAGYKAQLRELNEIAKKYKIETRQAFNQVNDIEGTKKDLNETLKSKPARDNEAFSDAIKRLLYILR